MLSVLVVGGVALSDEAYGRAVAKPPMRWQAPDAKSPFFQDARVSLGTTPSTTRVFGEDPWDGVQRLLDGWDGQGAIAPLADAINHAKRFAARMNARGVTFEPFADPEGGIGLQADKGNDVSYLIVTAGDKFSYVIRKGDKVHRGDNIDSDTMLEIVALLH